MSAVAENVSTEMPAPLLFTDSAAAKVADLIAEEGNPELKLRVFVQGGGCSGFQYGFTFDEIANDDDTVMEKNGVQLLIDAMSAFALEGRKNKLLKLIGRRPDYGPLENAFAGLPKREMAAALVGIVRSQIPGHNPEHEKLPVLAGEWFDRFDAGYDVTQWYTGKKAADV